MGPARRPQPRPRRPAPGAPPPQLSAAGQLPASALGPERTALLEWSLVSDWTWRRDAGKLGLSDRTAKDRVVEAIAALTLWCQGQPVPPPPRTRFRIKPSS